MLLADGPFLEGKNTLEKFNKEGACVLLTVKENLSFCNGSSAAPPQKKDEEWRNEKPVKTPFTNKN